MNRLLSILALCGVWLALGAGEAAAQQSGTWPAVKITEDFRGSGFYLSWFKLLAAWLLFALWVKTTDWVSTDCRDLKLNHLRWNPIVFGSFMGAMVLFWVIPMFWVGFPLLVIAYLAPFVAYVLHRNSHVEDNLKVFTLEHLRFWASENLERVGIKISAEGRNKDVAVTEVVLRSRGKGSGEELANRIRLAYEHPGMRHLQAILTDAMSWQAMGIMLDYKPEAVAPKYLVDGVWHNREALDREAADPALETMKILCGLNGEDRQNRQEGLFAAEYGTLEYAGKFASQGTKTGERALWMLQDQRIRLKTYDEIGLRPKLQEKLKELVATEQGFVLFSAAPGEGLRTTMDVLLHNTDRFMREFVAVEEAGNRYKEVENVPVTTYSADEGQTPATIFPGLFRLHPNVILVRDLVDAKSVGMLCETIEEKRLVIGCVRAKDSAEALLRVLALKVPPATFAKVAVGVVHQRLIRKLCDACKEAYEPDPKLLQQLRIPAGQVEAFYRPPQQSEDVCKECGGVGYKGRTAIFEVVSIGKTMRKVLATSPKLDLLRQAARKDGATAPQEEGILLVAKGVTSMSELKRILKQ